MILTYSDIQADIYNDLKYILVQYFEHAGKLCKPQPEYHRNSDDYRIYLYKQGYLQKTHHTDPLLAVYELTFKALWYIHASPYTLSRTPDEYIKTSSFFPDVLHIFPERAKPLENCMNINITQGYYRDINGKIEQKRI